MKILYVIVCVAGVVSIYSTGSVWVSRGAVFDSTFALLLQVVLLYPALLLGLLVKSVPEKVRPFLLVLVGVLLVGSMMACAAFVLLRTPAS